MRGHTVEGWRRSGKASQRIQYLEVAGAEAKDGGETYLAGSVDNVALVIGSLVVHALSERRLDGGVVRFHKVVVDILQHERGLPCRWRKAPVSSSYLGRLREGITDIPTDREPSTTIRRCFMSRLLGGLGTKAGVWTG